MNAKYQNAIEQAREERDYLLSKRYVVRDGLDEFRKRLSTNMVAVVTGPRRAGKSVFALTALSGEEFAYVNLEDDQLAGAAPEEILQAAVSVYGPLKTLFLDEVHHLAGWETFVTRLHRRGYRLVVSGSNAHLLQKELATALTGRYIAHQVLPFGFREYCEARAIDVQLTQPGAAVHALRSYLDAGGYPEPTVTGGDARSYVSTLFDAVIYKDIVARHRVRYPAHLSDVALYFASVPGGEYTFNAISKLTSGASVVTVQKYAEYLQEAYLFLSLPSFSYSAAQRLKAARKAYPIDTVILSARGGRFSHNWGRLLEAAVFLELVRRGYQPGQTLFFYKTKQNREVDFVLKSGLSVERLIQVCYDTSDAATLERECRALAEASGELRNPPCELIAMDHEDTLNFKGVAIRCVPAWKWLSTSADQTHT